MLEKFSTWIDVFSDMLGRLLSWAIVIMVVLTTVVVFLRYGLQIGSIAIQEAVTYLHGMAFMLAAGYTLKRDGHVRVDIFYRHFSRRQQAWVNAIGTIVFLIPLSLFIFGISLDYVVSSWRIGEVSAEPGGIPAVFLLKTLIPLMAVLLLLQGLSVLMRETHILISPAENH